LEILGFLNWAKQHRAPLTPTWQLHLALAAGSYDPKAQSEDQRTNRAFVGKAPSG